MLAVKRTINKILENLEKKHIWFFTIKNGAYFETRSYSCIFTKVQAYLDTKPKATVGTIESLYHTIKNAERIYEQLDFGIKVDSQEPEAHKRLNDYIRQRVFVVGGRDFQVTEERIAAQTILAHIQAEIDLGYVQNKTLGSSIALKDVVSGSWMPQEK